jgi:hypothetical protein
MATDSLPSCWVLTLCAYAEMRGETSGSPCSIVFARLSLQHVDGSLKLVAPPVGLTKPSDRFAALLGSSGGDVNPTRGSC